MRLREHQCVGSATSTQAEENEGEERAHSKRVKKEERRRIKGGRKGEERRGGMRELEQEYT